MLISAQMLADQLGERLIESRFVPVEYPGFESVGLALPGTGFSDPKLAYVIEAGQLGDLTDIDPSCLLISTAAPKDDVKCSLLICRSSIAEIYAAALEAVSRLNSLEQCLTMGLLDNRDFNYFLQICAEFFRNKMQILDPAFNVVASIEPIFSAADGSLVGFCEDVSEFTTSMLDEMSKSNQLRETYQFRSARRYQSPTFSHCAVILNLFEGEKYLGKLLLIESQSPAKAGDLDVINRIQPYFNHLMVKRKAGLNASLFTSEYFISQIVNGRITERRFIEERLKQIGWAVDNSYVVLSVLVFSQELINYYLQSLGRILRQAVVFPLEDSIVAVIRLTDLVPGELNAQMVRFLTDSSLYGGMSDEFNDFTLAGTFLIQAKAAVMTGSRLAQDRHYFVYADYALAHLLSLPLDSQGLSAFMHPAIRTIGQYDLVNQTDFVETLRVYLQSGCNQVRTSKALHIHRNSLKYRLLRLREIAAIDLDNPEVQLRLNLSYRLRDNRPAST